MSAMNPIYELVVLEAVRRQCESRRTDPRVGSHNSGIGIGMGFGLCKEGVGIDALLMWIESRERCVYTDLARRCVHPASVTPPTSELVEQVSEFKALVRGVVQGSLANLCRLTPANGVVGDRGKGNVNMSGNAGVVSGNNNADRDRDGDGDHNALLEKRESWKTFLNRRSGNGGVLREEDHCRSSTCGCGWRWMDFIGVPSTTKRLGGGGGAVGEEIRIHMPSFEQWDVELQSAVRRVGDVVSAAQTEMLLALDQLGDGRFPYLTDESYTVHSPSIWMQLVVLFENAFESVVRGVVEFILWCMHQQFLGHEGMGVRPLFTVKAIWSYTGGSVVLSPSPPEIHERIMRRIKKEFIWSIVPEFTLSHMTKRPVPTIGRVKRPLLRELLMEDTTIKRLWDNIYYTVSQRCDELSDMTRNLTETYTFYFSSEEEFAHLDIHRLREMRETVQSSSTDFIQPAGAGAFAVQIESLLQVIQGKLEKSILTAQKALEQAVVHANVKMTSTRCKALFGGGCSASNASTLTDRLIAFRAGRKVINKYDKGLDPEAYIARFLEEQRAESLHLRPSSATTGGRESSSALQISSQKSSSGSTVPTISAPVTVAPTTIKETFASTGKKYVNRWAPPKVVSPTGSNHHSTQETSMDGNAMDLLKSRVLTPRPTSSSSSSRWPLNSNSKNLQSSLEDHLSRSTSQTSSQRPQSVEKATEKSLSSLLGLRQDQSRGVKNYSPALNLQSVKQRSYDKTPVRESVDKERPTPTASHPSRYDTEKKRIDDNIVSTSPVRETTDNERPTPTAIHPSRYDTEKKRRIDDNIVSTTPVRESVDKERPTPTASHPSRYDTEKKRIDDNIVSTSPVRETTDKERPTPTASHPSRYDTEKKRRIDDNIVSTSPVRETKDKERPTSTANRTFTSVNKKPTVRNTAAIEAAVKRVERIKTMCPFLPETPSSGVFLEDLNLSDPRLETAMNRLRAVRGNASVMRSYRSIALAEDAVAAIVESIADDVYKLTVRMMTLFPFLESRVDGVLLGNIPELETDVEFQSLFTMYCDMVREEKPTASVIQCLQERASLLVEDIPYVVAEERYSLYPLLKPIIQETPSPTSAVDAAFSREESTQSLEIMPNVEKPTTTTTTTTTTATTAKVSEFHTQEPFMERRPVLDDTESLLPTTVSEKPVLQPQEQYLSQEKRKSVEMTKSIRESTPSVQRKPPETTKTTTKPPISSEYTSKSSKVKEGESTETANPNKNYGNIPLSQHSTFNVDNNTRRNFMQTGLGSNVDTTRMEKNENDIQNIRPTGGIMNSFPPPNKLFEERKPKRSLDSNLAVLPAVGERNVQSVSSNTRAGKEMITRGPLKENPTTQGSIQCKQQQQQQQQSPNSVHSPLVNLSPIEENRHHTDCPSFNSIKKVLDEEREHLESLESMLEDIRQAEIALQNKKEQSKGNAAKRRLSEEASQAVSNEDRDNLRKTLPLPRRFSAIPTENAASSSSAAVVVSSSSPNAGLKPNVSQRRTSAKATTTTTASANNEKKEAAPLGPLFEDRHNNPPVLGRKGGSEAEVLRQLFRERWNNRELNRMKESEMKDVKLGEGSRENIQSRTPMSFNSFTDAVVRSSWGALRNDSDPLYSQQLPSLPRSSTRTKRFPFRQEDNQLTQTQQQQQQEQQQPQQQQQQGPYSNKLSRLPWGRYTLHRKVPGLIASPRRLSSAPEPSRQSDDGSMPFPAISSGSSVDNLPHTSQDSQWECISNITTGMSQQYAALCRQAGIRPNSMLLRLLPDTHGASVSRIDTSVNYIGPKGLLPLLQVLRGNVGLEYLNLSHNNLENDEVIDLVNVLMTDSGASLRYLDLSNNPVSLAGGAALLRLVQTRPLLVTVGLKGTLVPRQLARSIQEACEANSAALA
ncbi:uncharacterized protein TM35_000261340 [Trypanosoma theileri]|uniref:Uncharacterized protein n=1 Tax=Trypanosoma theileri TaxID=67003 RepID=A0A1X0NPN4_9TRYP|nr:uncharacterized protein TM35_000261340 [Trypanosoma theileri]ORC86682.1 hypothetical protein TM35_000261340 [Trypanosoma theileri]